MSSAWLTPAGRGQIIVSYDGPGTLKSLLDHAELADEIIDELTATLYFIGPQLPMKGDLRKQAVRALKRVDALRNEAE